MFPVAVADLELKMKEFGPKGGRGASTSGSVFDTRTDNYS